MDWCGHDYSGHNYLPRMTYRLKLGDLIARITKFLRIPHCKNCEKRRIILNEISEAGIKETLKKLEDCCN